MTKTGDITGGITDEALLTVILEHEDETKFTHDEMAKVVALAAMLRERKLEKLSNRNRDWAVAIAKRAKLLGERRKPKPTGELVPIERTSSPGEQIAAGILAKAHPMPKPPPMRFRGER